MSIGQSRNPLSSFYDNYPWQGQFGIKANLIYANNFGFEIGLLTTDIPKKHTEKYEKAFPDEGWCFTNQNIFLSLKYISYNSFGFKTGYELNYVLLSGRINYELMYDEKYKNLTNHIYPEVGLTLFGFLNFMYGYRFSLTSLEVDNKHQFSVSGNYFFNYMKE